MIIMTIPLVMKDYHDDNDDKQKLETTFVNGDKQEEDSDENELVIFAIQGLGLDYLDKFEPKNRIIEWALRSDE